MLGLGMVFSKPKSNGKIIINNLIAPYGNFDIVGLTPGLGVGWISANVNGLDIIDNVQYFTPTAQWGSLKLILPDYIITGHKFYFCAYIKSINNPNISYVFEANVSNNTSLISIGTSDDFVFVSGILTATSASTANSRISVAHTTVGGYLQTAIKKVCLVDLTADFKGKEPDKDTFDLWMHNKIITDGYIMSAIY